MHLIAYDIENDSLRTKVAKSLIQYGCYRVQYSVFMGELKDRSIRSIQKAIKGYTQHDMWGTEDAVMVLPLHQYSEKHIRFYGKEPERWDEISGKIHTLVL